MPGTSIYTYVPLVVPGIDQLLLAAVRSSFHFSTARSTPLRFDYQIIENKFDSKVFEKTGNERVYLVPDNTYSYNPKRTPEDF